MKKLLRLFRVRDFWISLGLWAAFVLAAVVIALSLGCNGETDRDPEPQEFGVSALVPADTLSADHPRVYDFRLIGTEGIIVQEFYSIHNGVERGDTLCIGRYRWCVAVVSSKRLEAAQGYDLQPIDLTVQFAGRR